MRSDDDECNYCRSRDELERVLSAFGIKKKTEPFPIQFRESVHMLFE